MADPQKPTKEVSIVPVPAAIFQRIVEQLSNQPYKDVAALVNILVTYKSQMIRVED